MRHVGAVLTAPGGDKRIISVHQPVGVSLLITPFNFPASMATRKIAPAIAAGCTMIIKPFLVFDDGYPHIRTRYHRATRPLTIAADGSR